MKKVMFIIVGLFTFLTVGCSSSNQDDVSAYEKIQNKLIKMETYQCEATVKYISNKGENEYDTKQFCKSTGEYRIETISPKEVEGNIVMFDGKMIWQYNPRVEGKISLNTPDKPARHEILLSSFMENYVKSHDVSLETANFGEGKSTVFEAKIPGDEKFFSTEKLWVDNETHMPLQLVVYDKENKERIIVTYKTFEYNVKLDDSLFKLY